MGEKLEVCKNELKICKNDLQVSTDAHDELLSSILNEEDIFESLYDVKPLY